MLNAHIKHICKTCVTFFRLRSFLGEINSPFGHVCIEERVAQLDGRFIVLVMTVLQVDSSQTTIRINDYPLQRLVIRPIRRATKGLKIDLQNVPTFLQLQWNTSHACIDTR